MRFRLFMILLTLTLPVTGFAKSTNIGDGFPNFGRSIRALGMGNAVLTRSGERVNDMYYNAATLRDIKGLDISALELQAAINTGLISLIKDSITLADDLQDSTSSSGDIDVFDAFIANRVGSFQSVEAAVPLFSIGLRGFGASIMAESRTTLAVRDAFANNFEIRSRNDAVLGAGYAHEFMIGDFDLTAGILLKGIYRNLLDADITQRDILRISNGGSMEDIVGYDQWEKAYGFGADLGLRLGVPIPGMELMDPRVAITYQDIGNTRFFSGDDTDDVQQSLNIAAGIHPDFGPVELSVEIGASQINQKRDFITMLHAGAEARFPIAPRIQLAARAGLNQGYPTAGISVDLPFFTIDGAIYGEEKGERTRVGSTYKYALGLGFHF